MSSLILTIKTPQTANDLSRLRFKREVKDILNAITGGYISAIVEAQSSGVDPVRAVANVTLLATAADATVTIAGTVLTAKASPSGVAQFNQSGTDAADAISLAAIVNAHPTLKQYVFAKAVTTDSSSKVFIYAAAAGVLGNLVTLTVSGTGLTASGAALIGGAGGAGTVAKILE